MTPDFPACLAALLQGLNLSLVKSALETAALGCFFLFLQMLKMF